MIGDPKCSYCGASKDDYRFVVPGPEVHICNACVGRALQQVLSDRPSVVPLSAQPPTYCAFCGKTAAEVKRIATTDTAGICNECLAQSFAILMEGERVLKGAVKF